MALALCDPSQLPKVSDEEREVRRVVVLLHQVGDLFLDWKFMRVNLMSIWAIQPVDPELCRCVFFWGGMKYSPVTVLWELFHKAIVKDSCEPTTISWNVMLGFWTLLIWKRWIESPGEIFQKMAWNLVFDAEVTDPDVFNYWPEV